MKPHTRILILSGPTHEYIDPVRFIGNASSGRMGKAIAEEAIMRGFFVEFVTGPVADSNLPDLGKNGTIHNVISAEEMLNQAKELFQRSEISIFAAAVSDYAPAEKLPSKIAKSTKEWALRLCPTLDIAKTLCIDKPSHQIAIGFALQTDDGEANARRKLAIKNLDGIVLNTPATLGAEAGTFSFLSTGSDNFDHWGCINKPTCAKNIFNTIGQLQSA